VSAPVSLTISGGVARLTLTNPEGRNVVDGAFVEAFADHALRCAEDDSISVIIVAAEGEFFSVGGDLNAFVGYGDDAESHILPLANAFHLGVARLHSAPAPVVLALKGMAAGGGFSLVCGADMVIAARSARMTSAYTRSGLTPDGGLTYFLERIVGYRKAFEIMALNPVMTAEEALSLSIVNLVVNDDDLTATVDAVALELAQAPARAQLGLKLLLRRSRGSVLSEQLQREAGMIARQAAHPETMARLRQFISRSKVSAVPAGQG
jgi:2-(1,2-epoxy-1,2-dihydrophenyl)acetyl-CoA isomerase